MKYPVTRNLCGGPFCGYDAEMEGQNIAISCASNALNTGNSSFKHYCAVYEDCGDFALFVGYMSNKDVKKDQRQQRKKHEAHTPHNKKANEEEIEIESAFFFPKKS